jgi:flagellar biosynthesis regulator FlaF
VVFLTVVAKVSPLNSGFKGLTHNSGCKCHTPNSGREGSDPPYGESALKGASMAATSADMQQLWKQKQQQQQQLLEQMQQRFEKFEQRLGPLEERADLQQQLQQQQLSTSHVVEAAAAASDSRQSVQAYMPASNISADLMRAAGASTNTLSAEVKASFAQLVIDAEAEAAAINRRPSVQACTGVQQCGPGEEGLAGRACL